MYGGYKYMKSHFEKMFFGIVMEPGSQLSCENVDLCHIVKMSVYPKIRTDWRNWLVLVDIWRWGCYNKAFGTMVISGRTMSNQTSSSLSATKHENPDTLLHSPHTFLVVCISPLLPHGWNREEVFHWRNTRRNHGDGKVPHTVVRWGGKYVHAGKSWNRNARRSNRWVF